MRFAPPDFPDTTIGQELNCWSGATADVESKRADIAFLSMTERARDYSSIV